MTTRREFLFRTAAAVGLSAWANGDRPFFYVQHVHPRDTCSGSAKGDRQIRAALNTFPNAIALTGHSHRPNWLEESFWHGEFVSVECGCAKKTEGPVPVKR